MINRELLFATDYYLIRYAQSIHSQSNLYRQDNQNFLQK